MGEVHYVYGRKTKLFQLYMLNSAQGYGKVINIHGHLPISLGAT
jgi:hypothetical protein